MVRNQLSKNSEDHTASSKAILRTIGGSRESRPYLGMMSNNSKAVLISLSGYEEGVIEEDGGDNKKTWVSKNSSPVSMNRQPDLQTMLDLIDIKKKSPFAFVRFEEKRAMSINEKGLMVQLNPYS
jgi:hypothetical protein